MIVKLRAEKGGRTDGGRDGRNRLVARGCGGREVPGGEQVEGSTTESAVTGSGGRRNWMLFQVNR